MKIQEKPDYLIFADSAKKGEVSDFPDVSRGWGVTIEQTGSKPPLEWMNGAFNRVDKNMLYLLQQGVPEWSESVKYPANAIIKHNGVLYTSIVENDNSTPATNTTKWKKTQAEASKASTTQSGIVKLSSEINSTSETEAATPLAVKKVNDNAISANSNANNAHKNIELLGGRILAVADKFTSGGIESRVYSHDKRFYFLVRNDGLVGLFDSSENRLLWAFRDNYLEEGVIPVNRVVNLNEHIMSMFGQSFGDSGYAKLPNGLIIQWGVAQYQSATGGKGTVQYFFTAFPTTCFLMMCSDGGEGVHIASASPISNTQFKCWGRRPTSSAVYADTSMSYIAIGF